MKSFKAICSAVFALVTASATLLGSAGADENPQARPADGMAVSPGGVDMRTGRFVVNVEDLSIGGGSPGSIEFRRTTPLEQPYGGPGTGALMQFDDNWNMTLKQYRACANDPTNCITALNYVENIAVNLLETSFEFGSSNNVSDIRLKSNAAYAKLTRTMVGTTQNYYTLISNDGTAVVFETIAYPGPMSGYATARPVTITKPDGSSLVFAYGSGGLATIISNAGYKLILERNGANQITKACVVNLAKLTAGTSCPAGVQTVSYAYTGTTMTSFTDRTNAVWSFSRTTASGAITLIDKYFRPGESNPYVTNSWGKAAGNNNVIVSQDFADGRHYDYAYNGETYYISQSGGEELDKDFNLGTGWTLNGTITTSIEFGSNGGLPPIITPTPMGVVDANGRTFTWTYPPVQQWTGGALLQGRTMPEGNSEAYTYDAYRNITKIDRAPKSGSPLAHIITSSTFSNCANANLVACNKPTATVDANNKQSEYTYSTTHGGLLTTSQPADPSGVRPIMRYAYAQRYAWISNGAGGFVQASSPIWLMTEQRACTATATTGNACAGGGSDEVVTTYDYGPNSGPNNLWLRGMAVTAGGQTLRTCYGYDDYGRKISETKPNTNLTVCP